MEFIVVVAFVLGLLGGLARLTVGYEINSADLLEGYHERPLPLWYTRPGPVA